MYVCLFQVHKSKHENPIAGQSQAYFQAPPKCFMEENMSLQSTAVAGLWKLWRYPQFYRGYILFVIRSITVHNCLNEESQLIYHLICYLFFDCILLPSEVFVMVVSWELNLNKLYGLWKFSC